MSWIRTLLIFAMIFMRFVPACSAQANARSWAFQDRETFDPLIADPHGAAVNVMFWGRTGAYEYSQKPGHRRIWNITLGKEIGLFGRESTRETQSRIQTKWGYGFWIPVSFHMIEDFADKSNPILNTDYRFSWLQFKAHRAFGQKSFASLKLQSGHESTHLGDEFTIAARRSFQANENSGQARPCTGTFTGGAPRPECFERVNVSYEFWEYGLSWDTSRDVLSSTDPSSSTRTTIANDHITLRTGGLGLLRPYKGFYEGELLEPGRGGRSSIARSSNNYEHYLGAQWWRTESSDTNSGLWRRFRRGYGLFASLHVKYAKVYDYDKTSRHEPDGRQWSFNSMAGIRKGPRSLGSRVKPDFYFRYYHGVNPYGQFRNQRNYSLVGVGLYYAL